MNGKATKKPVEINYFKWYNSRWMSLKSWVEQSGEDVEDHFVYEAGELKVYTLEGSSYIVPDGYIIIRGVEGEYYPCEPKIFEKTYDIIS